METWKHLRAILLLPVTGSVVIPGVILWLTGPDTLGLWQSWPGNPCGPADPRRRAGSAWASC